MSDKPSEADLATGWALRDRHWPTDPREGNPLSLEEDVARAIHEARQEERARFRALVVNLRKVAELVQDNTSDLGERLKQEGMIHAFTTVLRGL